MNAGNYDEYFGMATDIEAVVYLMLMNQMLHDLFPTCITIGEDVSGMPTFARFVTSAQWLSPPLLNGFHHLCPIQTLQDFHLLIMSKLKDQHSC